ncbi:unnamed protein product [Candidula unifasciata]|uniref:Uncharacterized protein n=1 Tax=Candidula unifasciata TaxID=100452 RepID=A0A8S3YR63_9EUPU|nr:unnamed protein product [Candidula unifasciata]
MADEDNVDTYGVIKDGIRYQIMKENNKRTSFSSNNQQIVFRGRQVLEGIEKSEKLMSSDFRRQQTALIDKFEKLQKKRETLGILQPSWSLTERRHSEPIVRDVQIHSPLLHRFPQTQHGLKTHVNMQQQNPINPRISVARRQSEETRKEILATSLPRLEAIMASSRRRATIAGNASLSDYFPSSQELNKLSRLYKQTSRVDEESD